MCYVPGDVVKRNFMRGVISKEKHDEAVIELRESLKLTILKVNNHLHSGYEKNDARCSESIFMNFFKKQSTVLHQDYMMRIKNRDLKLHLDSERYINSVSFTDNAYDSYQGMTDAITLLNEACEGLDYATLKEKAFTQDKFFQVTSKIIQGINDFKFG